MGQNKKPLVINNKLKVIWKYKNLKKIQQEIYNSHEMKYYSIHGYHNLNTKFIIFVLVTDTF